jgi:hypothetical protein
VADLRRAAGLLRANGVVVLTTCDAASLAARLSGSRWHLLIPRHHYFFFTPASLGRAGLRPLAITHPGGRYSVGYLAHKLRTLADVAPLRRVADWTSTGSVGGVSVPVNLFDIMTVVAIRQPPPGV